LKSISPIFVLLFPALLVYTWGVAQQKRAKDGLPSMGQLDALPILFEPGTQTRQFSSYDPSGSNNDGNFTTAYTKYIDSNGEYVIFDASGPGCLYRQQYNIWYMLKLTEKTRNNRIRYYFDGEQQPRIDLTIDELFNGKIFPFQIPFTFMDSLRRFANLYYPFTFKKRLKITTTSDLNLLSTIPGVPYDAAWYQFTFLTYAAAPSLNSWEANDSAAYADVLSQWTNTGSDPKPVSGNLKIGETVSISPGQHVTVAMIKGEGSVTAIRIRPRPYNRDIFYHTHIRIYWDEASEPAVNMPLANFFGAGGETYKNCSNIYERQLKTLMYGYDGKSHDFFCYWPMPYWKSARIELWNDSQTKLDSLQFTIEYKPAGVHRYEPNNTGYFYAKRTINQDIGLDNYSRIFFERGRGHIVGLSFYSNNYAMDGDEFVYIDGSHTPQIHGDGTEDDHNQGWGGDAYQKPLWGGLVNGYQGSYRLYLNDAYVFHRDIAINYEFSREGGEDYGGEVEAVLFYYKSAQPLQLVLTDALDVGKPQSEKAHRYSISKKTWKDEKYSGYDGYERNYEYDMLRDDGYGHEGHSEFTAIVSPLNEGIRLRRRIYRSGNGIQRAKVYVDGILIKERTWDICTQSLAPHYQAWYDSDFDIPADYTKGKKSIRIRVEYFDGEGCKTDINEFYYWVYSYTNQLRETSAEIIGLNGKETGPSTVRLSWRLSDSSYRGGQYFQIYRSMQRNFSNPMLVGSTNATQYFDKLLIPGNRYFYRVVMNDSMQHSSPIQSVHAIKASAQTTTVKYSGMDTVTKGSWSAKYGSEGFILLHYFFARNCQVLPEYISQVNYGRMGGISFSSWYNSTIASLNASPINPTKRYLGALQTDSIDSITVHINDHQKHRLALYICDYDKKERQEKIEITDLKGSVLCTKTVVDFPKGNWLLFEFSGSFRIRLTNLVRKSNAVISALLFDPI